MIFRCEKCGRVYSYVSTPNGDSDEEYCGTCSDCRNGRDDDSGGCLSVVLIFVLSLSLLSLLAFCRCDDKASIHQCNDGRYEVSCETGTTVSKRYVDTYIEALRTAEEFERLNKALKEQDAKGR